MGKSKDLATLATTLNNGVNLQPNLIINGDMSVDQRNSGSLVTVSNSTDTFCPDRFRFTENHSGTFTIQQVEDAPDDLEYSSKITVTGTDTSLAATEFARILQGIEGKNISHLNWGSSSAKTCTLTFYVKSSVTGKYYISINNNATNRNMLKAYTINTADTWEKKTIKIIGDTSGTWLTTNATGIYIMWTLGTGSTYQSSTVDAYQSGFYMGASDQTNLAATSGATWQLTGVSFVVGDTAPVTHPYESYDENLARCQRYYWNYLTLNNQYQTMGNGSLYTASSAYINFDFPVQMRAEPTLGAAASYIVFISNGGSGAASSVAGDYGSVNNKRVNLVLASSLTSGHAGFGFSQSTSDRLYFDAEL